MVVWTVEGSVTEGSVKSSEAVLLGRGFGRFIETGLFASSCQEVGRGWIGRPRTRAERSEVRPAGRRRDGNATGGRRRWPPPAPCCQQPDGKGDDEPSACGYRRRGLRGSTSLALRLSLVARPDRRVCSTPRTMTRRSRPRQARRGRVALDVGAIGANGAA